MQYCNGLRLGCQPPDRRPLCRVVTSGLGGVYPRGIPIGVVIEESDAEEGWRRSYWLRPFVSPGEATHVQVLVSRGPPDTEVRPRR